MEVLHVIQFTDTANCGDVLSSCFHRSQDLYSAPISIMPLAPQGMTQISGVSMGSCASAVRCLQSKKTGHQTLNRLFKDLYVLSVFL